MRVSTKDQSLELPKDGLKKYGVEGIYAEKEPGGKWDRPGDTLVVYKLDRLARSQKQLIEIADRLRQEDVELVSISGATGHEDGDRQGYVRDEWSRGRIRAKHIP
ncbi:recombinase family protein [Rossellomorea sp. FS2]|uniref:recombinase family protein n=1 Tax=Rossellomorea sp. FS2 TaxID=3391447 RepID=UPI003A4D406B